MACNNTNNINDIFMDVSSWYSQNLVGNAAPPNFATCDDFYDFCEMLVTFGYIDETVNGMDTCDFMFSCQRLDAFDMDCSGCECPADNPNWDAIIGCMDPNALNYNPDAEVEYSNSCEYPPEAVSGCTDQYAENYDPGAEVDDGSCEYDPPPVYGYCTLLDGSITENITEDECLLTQGAEWTEGEYEEPEEEEEPIVPSDDQDDIPIVTQTDALITNPADIIHHIIKEEIQTSGSVNTVLAKKARDYHKFRFFNDGFDVNNQWHNWKFGFTISEKINSKDLLEDLAKSTKLFPRFMSNGQFGFNVIKDIYSVQQTGPNNDIKASINKGDILKYSIKKTSKDKVYTRIKIKYRNRSISPSQNF